MPHYTDTMINVPPSLNLHAVIPSSRVNGPGKRLVVFFQGCRRNCAGCFNPQTHPIKPKNMMTLKIESLFSSYLKPSIDGITISGGEPFLQSAGLKELLKTARHEKALTTVVYTGFTIEEVLASNEMSPCLEFIDVLIDGVFDKNKKEPSLLARGSTNQRLHFLTGRYTPSDFYMPGKAEVLIAKDGTITGTGFGTITLPGAGIAGHSRNEQAKSI
jgi:anaerobic ribonucleoside-triphosphate reductase activating protein